MSVVELGPEHCDALLRFFSGLPEGDLTFIEEEVTDPETVRSWASGEGAGGRWVAVDDDGEVTGYVAVRPLPGWSDHVGEVRLVGLPRPPGLRARPGAGPAGAGGGGRRRAARSSSSRSWRSRARRWRCSPTSGSPARRCCTDHIRDRSGQLRDLMVLAHHVGRTWQEMDTVGDRRRARQPATEFSAR